MAGRAYFRTRTDTRYSENLGTSIGYIPVLDTRADLKNGYILGYSPSLVIFPRVQSPGQSTRPDHGGQGDADELPSLS